jgi:hypothetical protein
VVECWHAISHFGMVVQRPLRLTGRWNCFTLVFRTPFWSVAARVFLSSTVAGFLRGQPRAGALQASRSGGAAGLQKQSQSARPGQSMAQGAACQTGKGLRWPGAPFGWPGGRGDGGGPHIQGCLAIERPIQRWRGFKALPGSGTGADPAPRGGDWCTISCAGDA